MRKTFRVYLWYLGHRLNTRDKLKQTLILSLLIINQKIKLVKKHYPIKWIIILKT
jgi:hypothetical protein